MKILSFFPISRVLNFGLTYSGGERRFIEICKVWSALDNDIHVVTSSYGRRLMQEFNYKPSTYLYDSMRHRLGGLSDFIDIQRMLREVPDENFDLIYTPGETFSCVVASGRSRRELKLPTVASVNLLGPDEIRAYKQFLHLFKRSIYSRNLYSNLKAFPRSMLLALKSSIRNYFTRNFDLIFSVGTEVKSLLMSMGINDDRIFIVGAGINLSHIQNVSNGEKVYDACFMGQIIPRKGVADLVESWRLVVQEKPGAKLVVLGRGSKQYEITIRNLIRKYDLQGNVSMPGFVSEKEKYSILKRSKVFVFPSYLEAFGQAICEAMACELPVVAYDLPFYDDWYGDKILRVEKGDVRGLSLTVLCLLDDKKLRDRIGFESRRVAEQYSWENIAKYQIEVITKRFL